MAETAKCWEHRPGWAMHPSSEITRLMAIERRLNLLFRGSDEWVTEILHPGPGWETDKALACVREIRALCEGKTAEEVSWLPVK